MADTLCAPAPITHDTRTTTTPKPATASRRSVVGIKPEDDNAVACPAANATMFDPQQVVHVARSMEQVERAWGLVYHTYSNLGLIDANAHEMHAVPEAIHPSTAVILHEEHDEALATLTIIQDRKHCLPLDCIYPTELVSLRGKGRRLMEIGMLAEAETGRGHSAKIMVEMMRHVFWFAYFHKSDILAGVHPRHAGFYEKYFGFQQIGPESTHPTVNHWPVVPLYIPVDQTLQQKKWPKGVAALAQGAMPLQAFKHRVHLSRETVAPTRIGAYLENRANQLAIRAA